MKTQADGSCEKIKLRSEINSAVCSILRLNATQQFFKKILFSKNKKCLLSIFFKPLDKDVSEIEEMQGNH